MSLNRRMVFAVICEDINMKRVFFIDYENVDTAGLNGLSALTSQDFVFIYYSERHSKMTFGLHHRINMSNAEFFYRKIKDRSKDSLDRELMDEANFEIVDPKADYYIISKDKGYDSFVKDKKREGFKVYRNENIISANDDKREQLRKTIQYRIGREYNLSDEQVSSIASMIMKSDNKSELNRMLQKMFYNEDVKYIFQRIKDITYNM